MKTSTRQPFAIGLAALALAVLTAEPALGQIQFERITTGEVVTDVGTSYGVSWGDYDNDGWVDLFIANSYGEPNCLYRNNGDGRFAKVMDGPIVTDGGDSEAGVWVDFDNDGDLDLFVTNYDPPNDFYYRNDGNGEFTRIPVGVLVNDGVASNGAACADYDNDGWPDLFVATPIGNDLLYRNTGLGEFERITDGPVVTTPGGTVGGSWADHDNDGDQDLYVTNAKLPPSEKNFLYRNEGNGRFTRILESSVVNEVGMSTGAAWGDYDNDGDLDLFVPRWHGEDNTLYRNEGGGTFTRILTEPMTDGGGNSTGAAWADFDNDGYLDLLVTHTHDEYSRLFHNRRDGSFEEVFGGELLSDTGYLGACGVADYGHDGYLDIYIVNGSQHPSGAYKVPNLLYRNAGSGNSWILIRLIGTVSNRSAVGASVSAKVAVWGKTIEQRRQVSAGEGIYVQHDRRLHFGLGDAALIDALRIEWPSGIVQELKEVAVNRILTVTEPARLIPQAAGGFQIKSWVNQSFDVQVSTDLVDWTTVTTVTNETGTLVFEDAAANQHAQRYYRVATPAR